MTPAKSLTFLGPRVKENVTEQNRNPVSSYKINWMVNQGNKMKRPRTEKSLLAPKNLTHGNFTCARHVSRRHARSSHRMLRKSNEMAVVYTHIRVNVLLKIIQ